MRSLAAEVAVRRARPDDATAVAQLLRTVSAESPFLGDYDLAPPPDNLRRLFDPAEGRLAAMVACRADSLLGYAHAVRGTVRPMAHVGVVAVAVDPAARRRGVGLALLEALARECRERGWLRLRASVWANNPGSLALFHKAGYREDAVIPDQLQDRDGRLTAEVVLSLVLGPDETGGTRRHGGADRG
jgi:ribosomal protein S18 acetylase RimI-like enzyme